MFVYIFKVTLEKFRFFFLLWVAKESCETVKSALNVLAKSFFTETNYHGDLFSLK